MSRNSEAIAEIVSFYKVVQTVDRLVQMHSLTNTLKQIAVNEKDVETAELMEYFSECLFKRIGRIANTLEIPPSKLYALVKLYGDGEPIE